MPKPVLKLAALLTALLMQTTLISSQERPRVGLALGGGSARGLAHIGVLRWLEEHRIPVDAITGTSMGGLVAGGYAAGRSADELVALVEDIDWDLLFLGDIRFDLKDFRRKEDRRKYLVRLELGLREGLTIASSLDPGHQIGLFISRVAYPYSLPLDFDDLPIPFRAVATDLEQAKVIVLGGGSLTRALRATMAIPGLFAPVELDGRLLVDGGLLNNIPVDVVRTLDVEHVIAVNVSPSLERREDLRSALQLASQALSVMMIARTRQLLENADVVLTPEVDDFTSTDWRRTDELIERGYTAAAAMQTILTPYALDPADWAQHLETRQARRVISAAPPQYLDVQGVADGRVETVHARLAPHLDRPIDVPQLERDLTRLAGAGHFESLMYQLTQDGESTGLRLDVTEKKHGPPFVNLSLDLKNEASDLFFSLGSRVTFHEVGTSNAEVRVDVDLGSDLGGAFEYFRPLGDTPFFVAGHAEYMRSRRDFFDGGALIVRYRTEQGGGGGDIGLSLGTTTEVRLGYSITGIEARVQVGSPLLPSFNGRQQTARFRWIYDGQDHWTVPTRGVRATTTFDWLIEAPNQDAELRQLGTDVSAFIPLTESDRIFFGFAGGASFNDQPDSFRQFTLGGRARLSAFDIDEFRGNNLLYVRGGFLRQIGRLPDFVGGPIYWFSALESGSTFDELALARVRSTLSGGLILETSVGPVLVSGSVAPSGARAFYFALGRLF